MLMLSGDSGKTKEETKIGFVAFVVFALVLLLAGLGQGIGVGKFVTNAIALFGALGLLVVLGVTLAVLGVTLRYLLLVIRFIMLCLQYLFAVIFGIHISFPNLRRKKEDDIKAQKKTPPSVKQSIIVHTKTECNFAVAKPGKCENTDAVKTQAIKEQPPVSLQDQMGAYVGNDALRQCAGVYVISRCDEGVVKVKVGMTKDFSRRFSQIKSHCRTAGIPEITPEILVPISVGRADVESAVLEQLSAHWESGEWFRMPVEDAINAVLTIALQHRLGKLESRRYIKPWEKRR